MHKRTCTFSSRASSTINPLNEFCHACISLGLTEFACRSLSPKIRPHDRPPSPWPCPPPAITILPPQCPPQYCLILVIGSHRAAQTRGPGHSRFCGEGESAPQSAPHRSREQERFDYALTWLMSSASCDLFPILPSWACSHRVCLTIKLFNCPANPI